MSFPYTVSVRLMVYNHESYIREAIDSILKQKTNFLIEVVIGDDFSTDKSLEIIREYQDTANIHFKILDRKVGGEYWQNRQKLGRLYNFINIVENCTGKYIALLDGDDYWTDPFKLQKQVDFLETNQEYNLVGHHIINSFKEKSGNFDKDTFSFDDIYYRNLRIPTASLVFRNNLEIPDWFFKIYGGDRALIYLNSIKGKIKILSFTGSFYRIHANGIEQLYKKEKFKYPIRCINEEIIYYHMIKKLPKGIRIYKKIIKYHVYILAYSFIKIRIDYFFKVLFSLLLFLTIKKVKIEYLP